MLYAILNACNSAIELELARVSTLDVSKEYRDTLAMAGNAIRKLMKFH